MNTCPKCGNPALLVEGVGGGKTRKSCQKCGWSTIVESDGRRLLTEVPQTDRRRLITEATA